MKFKDWLAASVIISVIPVLWMCQGFGIVQLGGEIIGATIMAWGLVLQHYFEKSKP